MPPLDREDQLITLIKKLEQNRTNIDAALRALQEHLTVVRTGSHPALEQRYARSHTATGRFRRLIFGSPPKKPPSKEGLDDV